MTLKIEVDRGLRILRSDLGKNLEAKVVELFTHDNPDHHKKKRMGFYVGNIPRTISSYEVEGDHLVLPRGSLSQLGRLLAREGIAYETYDERVDLDHVDFDILPGAVPIEFRDDQTRIIRAAIEKENCLIRAATGSGKTECALEVIRLLRQPALVIVWTKGLLEQWVDRICLRWGWHPRDVGVWGGGQKRIGKITIGMQQALARDCGELPSRVGTVACDEVQRFAAKTFQQVIGVFPARYRLGWSADETRKDKMEFLIREQFGEVAAEVSRKSLVDEGKLCDVEIVLVPTGVRIREVEEAPPEERSSLVGSSYREVLQALESNGPRNELAHRIAGDAARRGSSVLVFCNRIVQARELARLITAVEEVPCGLMLGGVENREEFKRSKERLASGEIRCAVGSSATYQGEDIPRLNVGVVVTPTASNKQLFEQQVGRLRRKFPGKVMGRLYVLWDERVFPKHADNLRKWYGNLVRIEER